jgi:hypothetical protein
MENSVVTFIRLDQLQKAMRCLLSLICTPFDSFVDLEAVIPHHRRIVKMVQNPRVKPRSTFRLPGGTHSRLWSPDLMYIY